ncbi:hypothetical protein ACJJIF_10780 [Microbulbifer sp. SSSA002]|uniref:hypothetical protein n=1 Tax=unclassified Microbulbifer TaxID=2619833 RepID=UPI00403A6441
MIPYLFRKIVWNGGGYDYYYFYFSSSGHVFWDVSDLIDECPPINKIANNRNLQGEYKLVNNQIDFSIDFYGEESRVKLCLSLYEGGGMVAEDEVLDAGGLLAGEWERCVN